MQNHYTIFGGPGCGKTTAMIRRIAKAVEETMYGGDILICSLTKTAAKEIADRVKLALPGVEFTHVGTVHALALRALKAIGDNPRLVYDSDLITDFNATYNRKLPLELGNILYEAEGTNFDLRILADIDRRRAAEQPVDDWPPRSLRLYNQWTAWKDAHGLLDFTDLIVRATVTCQEHPVHPRYIFVDEAQDLSRLEMRLIKQWSITTEKTIIAGDDQQALYEWRGASVKDFIEFSPTDNRYVLPRSHRMGFNIHEVAARMGNRISNKVEKEFSPASHAGESLMIDERSLLYRLELDIPHGSVMLLASCGYMLNPHLKELRRLGIPFHNPYRSRAEGKTWNPLKSRSAEAYRLFLAPTTGQQMWTWAQLYKIISHMQSDVVFSKIVNTYRSSKDVVPPEIMDEHCPKEFIEAARTGDYVWYWDHLLQKERIGTHGSITPMSYLKRMMDRFGVEALTKDPNLIVGTIHSVKGGEADVVYLLPNLSPVAHKHMGQSRADHDSVLRTFYVGMSRARHKLVLVRNPEERRSMWH